MSEALLKQVGLQSILDEADACRTRSKECERRSKRFRSWLAGDGEHWDRERWRWLDQEDRWRKLYWALMDELKKQLQQLEKPSE